MLRLWQTGYRSMPGVGKAAQQRSFGERTSLPDTNSIIYIVAWQRYNKDTEGMNDTGKRTVQVNVRMSETDFDLLQKAASLLWPGAVISNSGILLGLARLAAREALGDSSSATEREQSDRKRTTQRQS